MKKKQNSLKISGLLITQFLGAFNDSAWKLVVKFLAIRTILGAAGADHADFPRVQKETFYINAAFALPLMFFSFPSGLFADIWSKKKIMVGVKILEIFIMGAGLYFLWKSPTNLLPLALVLSCMGIHSAIFSPAKYGILPEILSHENLTRGNARLELWTFLAIISGTGIAGFLLDAVGTRTYLVSIILLGLSLVGFIASLSIPNVSAARSTGGMHLIVDAWKAIRSDTVLKLAVAGNVFFWFLAALLEQNVLIYSKTILRATDTAAGLPLALFGIGIGIGSFMAEKLSKQKIETGLIPLGALGMAASVWLIAGFAPQMLLLVTIMVALGTSAGLVTVPIQAMIQWYAPKDLRGAVISQSNFLTFGGVFVGSGAAWFLSTLNLSPIGIFGVTGVLTILGLAWALYILPSAFIRFILITLTNTLYRLRVTNQEAFPKEGGVLLTPNHVSFIDALILMTCTDRPIRFLVFEGYFEKPFLRPLMKALGCLPIASSQGPKQMLRSLKTAGDYLDKGEVVCIFPEGQLTRTGTMQAFARGMERIIKNRNAIILPAYLDKIWGSIFSFERGKFIWKIPHEFPATLHVVFGQAMDRNATVFDVRQKIVELSEVAWQERKSECKPLHHGCFRLAKSKPMALLMADHQTFHVSRLKFCTGSFLIAKKLKSALAGQQNVGILLPSSLGGALANVAMSLMGKTSVNLNFTTGESSFNSAVQQAEIQTILTSRAFLEKMPLKLPATCKVVHLEDCQFSLLQKIGGLLRVLLFPISWMEKSLGNYGRFNPDHIATIIFSSGSTGEPKGVMLSHFNLSSNTMALSQVFRTHKADTLLGILPFFHSFGTMSLWFVLQNGLRIVFHPNPLDAAFIGKQVEKYKVSILLATPTFLQLYTRRCSPAQFGSLRIALTGAEKLTEKTALMFEDTFGIKPVEGYGATECSPVIATSVPDFRAPGFFQPGSRRGYVGQPLPGVLTKVTDLETGALLPANTPGLLWVKGPNVMQGYLKRPDLTEKALQNGWYNTGDQAMISEDGFLKITDRLSRFSKIGGEMVPHGKVEEALHEAAGLTLLTFVVTAIPDEKKGELLAVIHTHSEEKLGDVLAKLGTMGLPNLFIPRKDKFIKVEKLPLLGTGKTDLRQAKQIALQSLS